MIDGIFVGGLNVINFNDVEFIEVFKDVLVVVIYGFWVVGGVIFVIIKCGKFGVLKLIFDVYVGI